jgi:tRNA(fMet)-specific endonuclease VapC
MGLILDTSEFIFAERTRLAVRDLLQRFAETDSLAISVITLAELQHGVRRAVTTQQRVSRERFITDVIASVAVIPVSVEIALRAGDLDAELELNGESLALDDLIIATTALEFDSAVVTSNVRHFSRVPGLQLIAPRR